MLTSHGVGLLVDVRTVPRSRTNPQFNRDVLPVSLREAGIRYEHAPALGGLRKPRPNSANIGWRNSNFRGYADHMQSADFESAVDRLMRWMEKDRIALMCAEAVPWRCHRSLIGDALTARGVAVREIVSPTKTQPHRLTPFAKFRGTSVIYPADAESTPELF
jgi:uncharacterized protein (DUF488 family)